MPQAVGAYGSACRFLQPICLNVADHPAVLPGFPLSVDDRHGNARWTLSIFEQDTMASGPRDRLSEKGADSEIWP
ncbi:hypothetical protein SAMN05518801_10238 [Novosphingobium sp. CF614]|uniref:hypothetical protein n=1 Tax=Novosphingobium sp. CF614 TaxID=1884364 RepID=UPI0008EB918C|nr:hypothetical protein [Novosphingobium sp. CF614]SFF82769.1 hypothetical protein SAMN05518801_10238 [Novosphingobium sp. CF614]